MIPIRLSDQVVEGHRVTIRPLAHRDRLTIRLWARNASPLLSGYNYGELTLPEANGWFASKTKPNCRYYAIDTPQRELIGYLGVKSVNGLTRSGKLGIVLDPAFQSQGYGDEALGLFLGLYFEIWHMRRMSLDVNQFNDRALRLYKKHGFRVVGEAQERFENQQLNLKDPLLQPYASHFFYLGPMLYAKLWRMRREA